MLSLFLFLNYLTFLFLNFFLIVFVKMAVCFLFFCYGTTIAVENFT